MGKRVIDAADGPGFLVNRCNRPFGLEALRLLQERVADVETIDASCARRGFRMGPFELQDLVGIDVGYEVSQSFHELSFGEPRWRPVAAERADGRRRRLRPQDRPRLVRVRRGDEPSDPDDRRRRRRRRPAVVVTGDLAIADELRALAARRLRRPASDAGGEAPG